MHLAKSEVERFYNIWFPLLHYVNQQKSIVPSFPEIWGEASVDPETAVPVRNALWEDDSIRQSFIEENPAKLNADDLALVQSWKWRVSGEFFIFRYLKKHTIFISTDSPPAAYGVHGLASPLEEIFGTYLPIYVQTTLIPFGDIIIYDSLLSSYPVFFGSGIKGSLKETYREIQERGRLITSLPASPIDNPEQIRISNQKIIKAFRKALGKSGLSPKKMQEHLDAITHFAEDFLITQSPPKLLLDITAQDIKSYVQTKSKVNFVSFKRFIWFLRDTMRIYWDDAEDLLAYLKDSRKK